MARPRLIDRVAAARAERVAGALLRPRRTIEARDGVDVRVGGRALVNFSGNDYLGLGQHLDVVAAFQEASAHHGVGSGASPLVTGFHHEHALLEREAAEWMGYPRALLFGSGYLANLALLQALLGPGDVCVQDKRNHACLIDGARLAGCELRRYPHRDAEAALRQLQSHRDGAALLATDGVFSMDGDLAPLRDLAMLSRSQEATLVVDDAHGIGVIGPEGRGSVAVANLGAAEVPLLVLPLGKAFGGQGALLLGSDALLGHVAETARPYLFSTAPPPAMAAAMRASLRLIRGEPWRRARLASLVMRFRRTALNAGVPLLESYTPIQPVLVGDNARALALAAQLEASGFLVAAIRPPTVPAGQARLRVALSVRHTDAHVDALVAALARAFAGTPAPAAFAAAAGPDDAVQAR
jgi:8-amino-7-oxononanoate synthase